jgi:hypothetical protein
MGGLLFVVRVDSRLCGWSAGVLWDSGRDGWRGDAAWR